MLAAQRQEQIAQLVERDGAVSVTDLVDRYGVSDMTIRRDLDALSGAGRVTKVHGGAVPVPSRRTEEPGFEAKASRMEAEKRAVADRAASLVRPGMAVALSAGTTTCELARRLRDVADLTVITNSTRVSEVLHAAPRPDRTVLLTGGERTPSDALVGPLAVDALRRLHADIVFLGTHGMSVEAGFTTPNVMEAETNQALLECAHESAVVADSAKWGVVGIATFAELARIDRVIVDDGLGDDAVETLREHVDDVALVAARGG